MRSTAPRAALALLLSVLLPGCAPRRIDVPLTWAFADGRGCADAGVADVAVQAGEEEAAQLFRCSAGQGGRSAVLRQVPIGARLLAAALSPGGAVLYRGEAEASSELDPVPILFYYTGGR